MEREEFKARILCVARLLTPGFASMTAFNLYKKRYKTTTAPYKNFGFDTLKAYLESGDIPVIKQREDGKFYVCEVKGANGKSIRSEIVEIVTREKKPVEERRIWKKLKLSPESEEKALKDFGFESLRSLLTSIPELEENGDNFSVAGQNARNQSNEGEDEWENEGSDSGVEGRAKTPVVVEKKRKKPVIIQVSSDEEEGPVPEKTAKIVTKGDDSVNKEQAIEEASTPTDCGSNGSGNVPISSSIDHKAQVMEGVKVPEEQFSNPSPATFQENFAPPIGFHGDPFCAPGLFPPPGPQFPQLMFSPPLPQFHPAPSKHDVFGQFVSSSLNEAERCSRLYAGLIHIVLFVDFSLCLSDCIRLS